MPQFALLGIASGIVTGLVIVTFRMLFELPLAYLLDDNPENFEALSQQYQFFLPFGGAIVLAILFTLLPIKYQRVGVIHPLERLARHQGHMPWQIP